MLNIYQVLYKSHFLAKKWDEMKNLLLIFIFSFFSIPKGKLTLATNFMFVKNRPSVPYCCTFIKSISLTSSQLYKLCYKDWGSVHRTISLLSFKTKQTTTFNLFTIVILFKISDDFKLFGFALSFKNVVTYLLLYCLLFFKNIHVSLHWALGRGRLQYDSFVTQC